MKFKDLIVFSIGITIMVGLIALYGNWTESQLHPPNSIQLSPGQSSNELTFRGFSSRFPVPTSVFDYNGGTFFIYSKTNKIVNIRNGPTFRIVN